MTDRAVPRRVLLLTSTPLEGSEGADKRLAALLPSAIPDTQFIWFTRWPSTGKPRLAVGRPIPIVSRDGAPHVGARLQVTAMGSLMARQADLVHAILTVGTGFRLLSRVWPLAFPSRPVIHTVPGAVKPHFLERVRPLGMTVALSEVTAQALRSAGFGDVRVIPPAISLASWPRQPRAATRPIVLFAGFHHPGGGAAEAIAVAAAARRAGARFRLVLAMRLRPGQDGRSLATALMGLARRERMDEVEVRGYVADMPGLLAATDVLLFTPRTLNGTADIPLTVLEAMATGRPVITSDLPQFADLGDGVLRVPTGDAELAGHMLAELLAQPRQWENAAERGYVIVQRFSPERFAAAYEALYRHVLSGSSNLMGHDTGSA